MHDWFILQRSQQIPINSALIKDTLLCSSPKFPDFKALMGGWKSGKKSEKNSTLFLF